MWNDICSVRKAHWASPVQASPEDFEECASEPCCNSLLRNRVPMTVSERCGEDGSSHVCEAQAGRTGGHAPDALSPLVMIRVTARARLPHHHASQRAGTWGEGGDSRALGTNSYSHFPKVSLSLRRASIQETKTRTQAQLGKLGRLLRVALGQSEVAPPTTLLLLCGAQLGLCFSVQIHLYQSRPDSEQLKLMQSPHMLPQGCNLPMFSDIRDLTKQTQP